jgi:hypothetical protein
MWAVVMFGAVIVVAVVVAALLTKFGGRAPGMEPEESATHDGAKSAAHNAEFGRGGFGG